ncbi:MAG: AraC family transcriptional regulator [Polyangiaceae bacterium]
MSSASFAGISMAVIEPVARVLRELGYVAADLRVEGGVVVGDVADAILEDAAKKLGDEALGLTMAQRIPIGGLGDLDYALCTSTTLREGLARLVRFYGLVTQRVTLAVTEAPPNLELVFTRTPPLTHSRHWVEFATAIISVRIRETLGVAIAFEDVSFAHSPPADHRVHDAFFGRTVDFSAPQDRLSFSSEMLDRPLLTTSAALAGVLDIKMKQLEPLMIARPPFLVVARTAIVELLDIKETGLAATSARLRTTPRTFQRQLRDHGTSHRELLDDVRRERALRLLEQGKIISEVSVALGFSEPSAFFRAFRRWTGASPREIMKRPSRSPSKE